LALRTEDDPELEDPEETLLTLPLLPPPPLGFAVRPAEDEPELRPAEDETPPLLEPPLLGAEVRPV
jgi:hypothetical protein